MIGQSYILHNINLSRVYHEWLYFANENFYRPQKSGYLACEGEI